MGVAEAQRQGDPPPCVEHKGRGIGVKPGRAGLGGPPAPLVGHRAVGAVVGPQGQVDRQPDRPGPHHLGQAFDQQPVAGRFQAVQIELGAEAFGQVVAHQIGAGRRDQLLADTLETTRLGGGRHQDRTWKMSWS